MCSVTFDYFINSLVLRIVHTVSINNSGCAVSGKIKIKYFVFDFSFLMMEMTEQDMKQVMWLLQERVNTTASFLSEKMCRGLSTLINNNHVSDMP